jgi:multidrug efflux pump subunit AcrA (membrane-fusion protein)
MGKADTEELKAGAELDAAKAKGKKPAIAKAEKKLARATRAALAARKAFVKVSGGDDPEQLKLEVAALQQQVESLTADLAVAEVKAPQAGTVTGLMAKPGAALAKDAAVLRLEVVRTIAVDLEVTQSDARVLKVGQEVSVKLGGKKFAGKLSEVSATSVVATVDNAKGELKSGVEGTATIAGGARSAMGRL